MQLRVVYHLVVSPAPPPTHHQPVSCYRTKFKDEPPLIAPPFLPCFTHFFATLPGRLVFYFRCCSLVHVFYTKPAATAAAAAATVLLRSCFDRFHERGGRMSLPGYGINILIFNLCSRVQFCACEAEVSSCCNQRASVQAQLRRRPLAVWESCSVSSR